MHSLQQAAYQYACPISLSYCKSTIITMSGPHYISVPKRRGPAAPEYLSPGDVAEFCTAILGAGLDLVASLAAKYPNADKVSEALYAVTTVWGFTARRVIGLRRGLEVPRVNFWRPLRSER